MTDDRETQLKQWIASIVGVPVRSLVRRPGGGRHQAWDVDFDDPSLQLFLRADAQQPRAREHYTIRREAEIYAALGPTTIPVPQVLGVHPTLPAVLLERVSGVAKFAALAEDAQRSIVADLVPIVVRLHALDVHTLALPSLAPVRSVAEHVVEELDHWESRLIACGAPEPFLFACFRWLRENVPHVDGPPVLVQGDTGPGNLLHDGQSVTALLDFELAHLGDPMEDLAWIATRNSQEPVPDYLDLLRQYEQHCGVDVDLDRLRYHMVFAELRIAVLAADRHSEVPDASADLGSGLIYGALHTRLTVEAVAAALGRALPEIELPDPGDTDVTGHFDGVLTQLRDIVVPAIGDPFAAQRAKSIARVLKFLREVDRHGSTPEHAELDGAAQLLGARPVSVMAARQALCDSVRRGDLDIAHLVPYAWERVRWEHAQLAPSMGVLATRHLPALIDFDRLSTEEPIHGR